MTFYYCNYNFMLHLFKSKNFRKANKLIDDAGLNNEDFREFRIEQIASNLKTYEMVFPSIIEVMHQIKLSPLKALKFVLFSLHIFHISREDSVYEQIFQLLHALQVRIHALLRAKKNIKLSDSTDTLSTSKDFLQRREEIVPIDLSSILLAKIAIPLISFQQKLMVCRDFIYSRNEQAQSQTWSRMNLLRKIVDIGSDIESLGRYYFKEIVNMVVCMMRILNSDIQCLYKRVVEYFRKKIVSLKIIFEQNKQDIAESIQNQGLEEFLMMIYELEVINEKLRVLYNGRYFIHHLANNYIYLPVLFTEDEHLDLFYKIKEYRTQREKKSKQMDNSYKKRNGEMLEIVDDI